MHKFPITQYKKLDELPLDKIDALNFSVFLTDFDWNYIFINRFAKKDLGDRGKDLVGKNMWKVFPELAFDPPFKQLKQNMERSVPTNIFTISPLSLKRLNLSGYRLEDCYYFTTSILPDKNELLHELRDELRKKNKS